MRRIQKSLFLGFSILLLAGCHVQTVNHEPAQAATDTNRFLKALYVDKDYPKALALADTQLRQSTTANDLKQMAEGIREQRGELKTLKADSYLMTPGRTMELFYIGEYTKGTLYHRLVLIGDVSSGYRVSGVWYQTEPYPDQTLRRRFDQDILVN